MLRKVVMTFSTRVITAILSVVNVLIGTNYLGGEGYGTIALIILGVTIFLLFHNLISGSSIIYFSSKFETSAIIVMSYCWGAVSVFLFSALIWLTHFTGLLFEKTIEIIPMKFAVHNILLALNYGLMNTHLNVLLSKERMKSYNFVFLLHHLLTTLCLLIFFLLLGKNELHYYLLALHISYFGSYIVAFALSYSYLRQFTLPRFSQFKNMLRYGALGQSANVFQLLNYRLSYYLIDLFIGRGSLGVFAAATQICEGLWIFSKSIATVQFARISNTNDMDYAVQLTKKLLKFTVVITTIPLILIMLMPISFITQFIGDDFVQIRPVIWWLAPGTLALATSMMLSHYFSGVGRIYMNTMASGIGVIVTFALGLTLIPVFGLDGGALVSSLSYLISFLFLFYRFSKEHAFGWREMLVTPTELRETYAIIAEKIIDVTNRNAKRN